MSQIAASTNAAHQRTFTVKIPSRKSTAASTNRNTMAVLLSLDTMYIGDSIAQVRHASVTVCDASADRTDHRRRLIDELFHPGPDEGVDVLGVSRCGRRLI